MKNEQDVKKNSYEQLKLDIEITNEEMQSLGLFMDPKTFGLDVIETNKE